MMYNQSRSKQSDVLQFAYTEICEANAKLPLSYNSESETRARFTRNAGLMLKAELELTLGRYSDARNTLNNISSDFYFGFANQELDIISVYTPNHLALYLKEAQGETDGLEQEWASMTGSRYGYWAALKRLGKAQEVTGCFDYELLMPIPRNEMLVNPSMTQNPGY